MAVRVVSVKGTPRERGRMHGEELRADIHAMIQRWHAALPVPTGQRPEDYVATFLAETDFAPAIAKWTPELAEEVAGIAEGSGVPESTITAFQLLDEQWFYEARKAGVAARDAHHCSGLAVLRGDRGPLLGQNMDIPEPYNGSQVVLRIEDEAADTTAYVFTAAGLIGLTGLNNRAVGVCVNTLMQLTSAPSGLPVAYAIRGVLSKGSVAAAAEFVSSMQHASGQNFLLAGATGSPTSRHPLVERRR